MTLSLSGKADFALWHKMRRMKITSQEQELGVLVEEIGLCMEWPVQSILFDHNFFPAESTASPTFETVISKILASFARDWGEKCCNFPMVFRLPLRSGFDSQYPKNLGTLKHVWLHTWGFPSELIAEALLFRQVLWTISGCNSWHEGWH